MAPETPHSDNWVDLTFLGGLGEIGLNLMTLETADYLVVVDAGLMFPEDPMLGIDIVIPDFSYLRERRDKVAALVLTHGHEDHIGAVPFFAQGNLDLPVYGTPLTLALLKEKLREHGLLEDADLREIKPAGAPHPGSLRIRVHPGVPLHRGRGGLRGAAPPRASWSHSGDFKIDQTPVAGGHHGPESLRPLRRSRRPGPDVRLHQRRAARLHPVRAPDRPHPGGPHPGGARAG